MMENKDAMQISIFCKIPCQENNARKSWIMLEITWNKNHTTHPTGFISLKNQAASKKDLNFGTTWVFPAHPFGSQLQPFPTYHPTIRLNAGLRPPATFVPSFVSLQL